MVETVDYFRRILFFFNDDFLFERFLTDGFVVIAFSADAVAGEGLTATESRSVAVRCDTTSGSTLVLGR